MKGLHKIKSKTWFYNVPQHKIEVNAKINLLQPLFWEPTKPYADKLLVTSKLASFYDSCASLINLLNFWKKYSFWVFLSYYIVKVFFTSVVQCNGWQKMPRCSRSTHLPLKSERRFFLYLQSSKKYRWWRWNRLKDRNSFALTNKLKKTVNLRTFWNVHFKPKLNNYKIEEEQSLFSGKMIFLFFLP